MHAVIPYAIAAVLFGLGVYGVLRRRNAVLVLMAVELMLNAINLIFVTADVTNQSHTGGAVTLFVIVLAAAEVGVGLAIVLQFYRLRKAVAIDEVALADVVPAEAERAEAGSAEAERAEAGSAEAEPTGEQAAAQ